VSNKSRRSSSGPSGRRSPAPQPASSSGRATLERLSAPWLVRLHGLPRWLVPVGLASLLFVGLLLAGDWAWLGAIFLAIIGLFITWLTALSWPILTGSSRMIRVVVAVVIFGLAVLKLLGRW
jgi:ABC-type multidrug transport system fused ATPase/permease subunit